MLVNRNSKAYDPTSYLKLRVSALESQYKTFVRYCLDMIQFHTALMQSELKNDPSTPREVLKLVNLHGENLEKSLKLASSHLQDLNENIDNFSLESFRTEIELLITTPYPENHKLSKLETIFCDLHMFVSHLCKKSSTSPERDLKRSKSRLESIENPVQQSKKEKIIKNLEKKLKEQEKIIHDKETMVEKVLQQLEKIKEMQISSVQKIKSSENLLIFSKDKAKVVKSVKTTLPSPSNQRFRNKINQKLVFLEKLVKELAEQAAGLKNTKVKQEEFGMILENFHFQTEEIEKVIDDIVTPRFEFEERAENDQSMNESVLKSDARVNEIKMLHEIVLNFKRNVNSLEKERDELKNELKGLRNSLRTTSEISTGDGFFKGTKKLMICRENSLNLQVTYHNENLIRALRKQLKEREKECHEKDSLIKHLNDKKTLVSKENRSSADDSETFHKNRRKIVLNIETASQFTVFAKTSKRNLELENLFTSFREVNQKLGFTNKKLDLCENEKNNLKQLLKNYENCLQTKEQQINLLIIEKENYSKVTDKNEDLVMENLNLKKFINRFVGWFQEIFIDFDLEMQKEFKKIQEFTELKISNLAALTKIVEKLKNSKKLKKSSNDLLTIRLADREKLIETLQNSLKLSESAIISYKTEISEMSKERKTLKELYEKALQETESKSKEIEEIRKRKDEKLIQKIEEHDEKVEKLTGILQKYEVQELTLNKRILSQSELIESLSQNYENAKKTAESYKEEIFNHLKSDKSQFLEAENQKLQQKLHQLEKKLKPSENERNQEAMYLKSLYKSQLSIIDKECRELKEKLDSTSTELFQERQKTMKIKEEYEKLLMEATLFNSYKD